MSFPSLQEKLKIELEKEIKDEAQVIYILSRIRKILEIGGKSQKKKHSILKFYCDWALHAEIHDTEPISELFEGVLANDNDAMINFMMFDPFFSALEKFLIEQDLPKQICQNDTYKFPFTRILSAVYSDTPLIRKEIKIRKIVWRDHTDPSSPGFSRAGSFDTK